MTSRQRYRRAFRAAVEAYIASKVSRKLQDKPEQPGPLQSSSSIAETLQPEDGKVPAVSEDDSSHALPQEDLLQEDEKVSTAEAANRLSAALASYSKQIQNEERPGPDTELQSARRKRDSELESARRKMKKAMQIVEEGGISHALCRSLLCEVLDWEVGITESDLQNNLAFDATEIKVDVEKAGPLEQYEETNVEFTFDGWRFRVVHLDKGLGYSIDDKPSHYSGTINLHFNDDLVLSMDIIRYAETWNPSYWGCSRVTALDPGDWMRVLLRISAKIDSYKRQQRERSNLDLDNDVLEAASRINLPDDMKNI
ncbi:MAG: hypothetical protein OXJ63_01275 [Gammaproteobacteria bacterium]|nr:hypothetical protein [Gammaproteobacteria bacterium]